MSFTQVLKSVSGIFGLIPGLAIMLTNLGIPPGQNKLLYGGVVEVFGALTLLLLFLNKEKIKTSKRNLTLLSIIFASISLISLAGYLFLSSQTIIQAGEYREILSPLWYEGDLAEKIEEKGIINLITEYGPAGVEQRIKEMPGISLEVTNGLFFLGQLMLFIPLILAFGIPGIKLSSKES